MKTTTVASALFAAVAAAQPHAHGHGHHHAKRELVTETAWVTEVEYVTQLVDSTTTVWITPGQEAAPTTTSAADAEFHEKPTTTSTSTSTTSTTSSAPPPPPAPKPTTTKVQPPAPKPTTTTKAAPPPPATTAEEPVATQPAATQPSSGGDSGDHQGSAGDKDGEITYYTVGVGSCGETQTGMDDSENIVALSTLLMTPLDPNGNPNNNPMCGQMITIHSNGKTAKGRVSDKCGACKINDIDVSEKLYKELWGGLGSGRMPVSWSFDDYSA